VNGGWSRAAGAGRQCAPAAPDLALLGGPSTSPLEATSLPFNPVVSSPNLRALGLGVMSYFVLGLIVGWLLPHVTHPVGWVMLSILFFAPGVVVGISAKRSPLMHGVLLGLLIVGFMAFLIALGGALGVKGTTEGLRQFGAFAVGSALVLMIFCSLAAVLGDFIGDRVRGL
jgi:hypothetical protein